MQQQSTPLSPSPSTGRYFVLGGVIYLKLPIAAVAAPAPSPSPEVA